KLRLPPLANVCTLFSPSAVKRFPAETTRSDRLAAAPRGTPLRDSIPAAALKLPEYPAGCCPSLRTGREIRISFDRRRCLPAADGSRRAASDGDRRPPVRSSMRRSCWPARPDRDGLGAAPSPAADRPAPPLQ